MKKILTITLTLAMVFCLASCFLFDDKEDDVIHPEGVLLNKEELTLEVGAEETLTAIVDLNATDRSVAWSSSDTSVATVDTNGKVVGVGVGTATVTVTTNDGGKTATCAVTVVPAPAKAVLTVKGTNALGDETDYIVFRSDGTYTAYGKFLGAVEFTYDSTYEVKDGVLTVPNPGPNVTTTFGEFPTYPTVEVWGDTVRFTVLSNNGSEITLAAFVLTKEQATTLGVTVGDPIEEIAVSGVSLKQTSVDLLSGKKLDLSDIVTVEPENATNKNYTVSIKTESNGDKCLIVDNGIVGLNAGSAVVVVTTEDGGFAAECTVTVSYPERAESVNGENYFSETTTFSGTQDLTAFGGTTHSLVYTFNTDGTLEIYQDNAIAQRGYYLLVGESGSYTEVKFQMFFDGESAKTLTTTDGKLTFNAGIEGILDIIMTESERVKEYFETEKSFGGQLDLSAFVPGLVQQKVWTFGTDGKLTGTTNGADDGETYSYYVLNADNTSSVVLELGANGTFTCALTETDGKLSFTVDALALTMTEQ